MSLRHRIWNVLRPDKVDRDLNRELAFHVRERADELRAGGMDPVEALRHARRQFGNYASQVERTRDMDINSYLDSALRNLQYSFRALRKAPGFTATVVLTLALGIGANSAVFSAIDAVLLRPLPFPDGDRLVSLAQTHPQDKQPQVAPVRLEDWNRLNSTFTAISGYYTEDDSELSGELPERLTSALVAPRFLQVWGVAPAIGRDFTPQEEKFGGPPAVLITDRLWHRRFQADPHVTSKALRVGRTSFPIVGVMPASFHFPDRRVDVFWVSAPDAPYAQSRTNTWFAAIGRLKTGVTIEQARANLSRVQAALAGQYPATDGKIKPRLELLKDITVAGIRRSLWILFGSVSLLLLIACTNIAALLLSRGAGRRHEVAVRFSLGASRAAVAWQLLTEVLLLSVAGAGVGLLVAAAASRVFRSLAADLPRVEEITLDWRIILYSLACALVVTLLAGIIPALRGTRRDLAESLAGAGRGHVSGRNRLQLLLVAVQVSLAVTLLAGAGLLLRSLQELSRVSPGFNPEHILSFQVSTSWGETTDRKVSHQRMEALSAAIGSLPGVESVASAYSLPGMPTEYAVELKSVEGRAESEPKLTAQARVVGPGYFATLGIPLLSGETCRDSTVETPSMMVNRSFATAYFGGNSVIGHHLTQPGNSFVPASEVRGIVGDARETGVDRPPVPTIYWCMGMHQPGTRIVARVHGDPRLMTGAIRRKIHDVAPNRSVYDVTPLTASISDAYAENRLRTVLLIFFATTAVVLACVGLYGTLSYMVNVRQREVGLRLALGALRSGIARQFLSQGLAVAVVGCAAGLALSAATARLLKGMLFGVTASDALTLGAVVAIILAVSAAASLIPAVRAARLDPMRVLREE